MRLNDGIVCNASRAETVCIIFFDELAAVLESQAFGHYKQPDYQKLLEKNNAAVLSEGETLQRNVTGCEAGIPSQGNGKQTFILSCLQ